MFLGMCENSWKSWNSILYFSKSGQVQRDKNWAWKNAITTIYFLFYHFKDKLQNFYKELLALTFNNIPTDCLFKDRNRTHD